MFSFFFLQRFQSEVDCLAGLTFVHLGESPSTVNVSIWHYIRIYIHIEVTILSRQAGILMK